MFFSGQFLTPWILIRMEAHADSGSGSVLQRIRIQTGVVEPGPPQSVKWMYRYHLSKKMVQVKILDSRSRQE